MRRLLSVLLLSLFFGVSAGTPSVDIMIFADLTKNLITDPEEDYPLPTKDLWQTYPYNLSSGCVCYFDMPSIPRGMMLAEDFFVLTSFDNAGHAYLVNFMEDFPFDAAPLDSFARMMLNQLIENGAHVIYYQNTYTFQGEEAIDFAVYDPNERAYSKLRLIHVADGTLVWLFTGSKDKWDQHDRFVGSFYIRAI